VLAVVDGELNRLLMLKDEAVMGAKYEQAADLRDQAEKVRLATQKILGEFEQLCEKVEKVLRELRGQ
jgi:hypothetical protein